MKRILFIAAIVLTLFSGCKQDKDDDINGVNPVEITVITASAPKDGDDTSAKLALAGPNFTQVRWATGDRIYVAQVTSGSAPTLDAAFALSAFSATTVATDGKSATFVMDEGQKPLVAGNTYIACHVVNFAGVAIAGGKLEFTPEPDVVQIADNKYDDAADRELFFISAPVQANVSGAAFAFKHVMSLFEFEIWTDEPADFPDFPIDRVTVQASDGTPFVTKLTYDAAGTFAPGATAGAMTVHLRNYGSRYPLDATHRKLRMSLMWNPAASPAGNFTFTLHSALGDQITFTKTANALTPGTLYQMEMKAQKIATDIFEGAGTEVSPYLIPTAAKLAEMRDLINAGTEPYADAGIYWRLENDIALSGDWTPIGSYLSASNFAVFRGNFDGSGKTITGLFINRPEVGYNGLFGRIVGGTVKNLGLEDVHITGLNYNGGIAGYISCGVVTGCFVSGTITGGDGVNAEYHGGIVGRINGGTISDCYTTGEFSGRYTIGGIAGEVNYGVTYDAEYNLTYHGATLSKCYSTADITSDNTAGGIAGRVMNSLTDVNVILEKCVALNASITSPGAVNCSRIATISLNGILANNLGWTGIMINGNPVTSTEADKNHGANLTTANAKLQTTYSSSPLNWIFGSGESEEQPWKWGTGDYTLPVLWWQTAMPEMTTLKEATKSIRVAMQKGTIYAGSTGSATFAVTTTNIANGQAGAVRWYSDADGTSTTSAPAGITISVSNTWDNAATITVTASGTTHTAATRYLRVTIDGIRSSVIRLTITPKTITVAEQNGTIYAGETGAATFAVTTTGIASGQAGTIQWYSNAGGTTAASAPAGITTSVYNVLSNATTVSATTIGSIYHTAGTHYFRITIDGVQSNVVKLTIAAARSITVAAQNNPIFEGVAGNTYCAVSLSGVSGTAEVLWYSNETGATTITAPAGISASSTQTLVSVFATGTTHTAGTYYFGIRIAGILSNVVTLSVTKPATSISFNRSSYYHYPGRLFSAAYTLTPSDADPRSITWSQTNDRPGLGVVTGNATNSSVSLKVTANDGWAANAGGTITLTGTLPNGANSSITIYSKFCMLIDRQPGMNFLPEWFNRGSYSFQNGGNRTMYVLATYPDGNAQWAGSGSMLEARMYTSIKTDNYTITSSSPDITITKWTGNDNIYQLTRSSTAGMRMVTLTITIGEQSYAQDVYLVD